MDADPQAIWRVVAKSYKELETDPPEGYAPIVQLHLLGEAAPVTVTRVETRQGLPWVLFSSFTEGKDDRRAYPSDRYVFVTEDQIARVEVGFERVEKAPTGFTYKDISGDD